MLSSSARKVQEALKQSGFENEVVELSQSARSAAEAAQAVGCDVGQIVKSLVFRGGQSGRAVLVVASGANRVDENRIAELLGETIERASPDFVRDQTGFAIGGVPPLGHANPILTYVDQDLLRYPEIWAAAGNPNVVFRLSPEELVRMTDGVVAQTN